MSAAEIAAALGDPHRDGRAWRCRCPLHGGRSLMLRDGEGGRVLVTCWGGCDRLEVLAELRRLGLLSGTRFERSSTAQLRRQSGGHQADEPDRIAWARDIWGTAQPALSTPVKRYFADRGIVLPPSASLRWAPRCWHRQARKFLPAMVALVEHVERGVVGIHRTYLRSDGAGKALVAPHKASLGPTSGGAVRIGTPRKGEWFAVAEGIETTCSVIDATGMQGWAALSASGLRCLILPPEATHVVICADNDSNGVGQNAAHDAAARWLSEGRRVRIVMPPEPDTDFNDLLTDAAAATEEARHGG